MMWGLDDVGAHGSAPPRCWTANLKDSLFFIYLRIFLLKPTLEKTQRLFSVVIVLLLLHLNTSFRKERFKGTV